MKKLLLSVLIALVCLAAAGQAKLQTKKFVISDLPQKSMKVVLTGNELLDVAFREAVSEVWNICPFEFCSQSDFEILKKSPDYYFLTVAESKGTRFVNMYKGTETAGEGLDGMYRVLRSPFSSADAQDGKEMLMFPVLMSIFQDQVDKMMHSPINMNGTVNTGTEQWFNKGFKGVIYLDEADLTFPKENSLLSYYAGNDILYVDTDEMENIINAAQAGDVVCYVVAPAEPVDGAENFTMLIDLHERKLLYIHGSKITESKPRGLRENELRSFIKRKK